MEATLTCLSIFQYHCINLCLKDVFFGVSDPVYYSRYLELMIDFDLFFISISLWWSFFIISLAIFLLLILIIMIFYGWVKKILFSFIFFKIDFPFSSFSSHWLSFFLFDCNFTTTGYFVNNIHKNDIQKKEVQEVFFEIKCLYQLMKNALKNYEIYLSL